MAPQTAGVTWITYRELMSHSGACAALSSERIRDGRPFETEDVVPEPHVRQQVTERFLAAALGGDLDALLQI